MGGLLSYSLSVSVIILVLYPVLHQIINRSHYFRFNRFAIITGLLLSLALPCVLDATIISLPSVPDVVNLDSIIKTDSTLSEAPSTGVPSDSATALPWLSIVLLVYLSGIVVLSFREIISFLRLFRMIAVSEKKRIDGVTVCRITDNDIAPFRWGYYIFLRDKEFHNTDCSY
ncbi:MAG: hypothetical protein K2G33_01340, partial [Duncaniella sp.]|nr:hypothetical protein [Duncaniella sp.]